MKKLFLILTLCIIVLVGCSSKIDSWQENYDLGIRYLSEGNYAEAIIAFTAAIEIDEKNIAAYLGRAESYIGSGETAENLSYALKDYEKVAELDETVSAAYLGMADVYIRQGEYDKALEILENAPDSAKNDEVTAKIAELKSGSVSDSSGKIRKMSTYDASGNLMWYHEYSYNENGTQNSVSHHIADGTITKTIDILFDEQGNEIQSYYYVSDSGLLGRITNEFDDKGQILKSCHYDYETDELEQYYINEYNAQGQEIKSTNFSPDGEIWGYDLTEYTSDGKIEKVSNYYSSYSYNWDVDVTEEPTFELSHYYVYEYNELGKRTKYSSFNNEGECDWYTINEYDKDGKLIRILDYNGDGTLERETKYN